MQTIEIHTHTHNQSGPLYLQPRRRRHPPHIIDTSNIAVQHSHISQKASHKPGITQQQQLQPRQQQQPLRRRFVMEKNYPNRDQVPLVVVSCQGKGMLSANFERCRPDHQHYNSSDMHNPARRKKALRQSSSSNNEANYSHLRDCRLQRSRLPRGERNMNSGAGAPPRQQLSVISLPQTLTSSSSSSSSSSKASATTTTPKTYSESLTGLICNVAVALLMAISFLSIIVTCQQDFVCTKVCRCDTLTGEVVCNVPFGASGVPHLLDPRTKRIIINNANISTIDGGSIYYKELEFLDVSQNKVPAIDLGSFIDFPRLVTINASHNSISELRDSGLAAIIKRHEEDEQRPPWDLDGKSEPEELRKFRKAKISIMELDLSHNQVTALRNYLFMRWYKLQRLDLSYNSIEILLTGSLVGLTKLEHLNLRGNRLSAVDAFVFQATTRSLGPQVSSPYDVPVSALKMIDLGENPILTLDDNSFTGLGLVQSLRLDNCAIKTIRDQALEGLTKLTSLSLAGNNLAEVPTEALNALSSLQTLDLSSNPMQSLPAHSFKHLYYLEELHMTNGSLRDIAPQAFAGLSSLRRLDLSHNFQLARITSTSSLFDNLPKLTYLNLYMCNTLGALQAPESIASHALTVLDLRNTSLACDCDLKWLTNHLKKLNETASSAHRNKAIVPHLDSQVRSVILDGALLEEMLNITCARPPALAGKRVLDLPDNKLECIHPSSPLNIQIGFASLFLMLLALTTVCLINVYNNERHLIGKLKENIVQNRISMMSPPYTQDASAKSVDNSTRETQMDECAAPEYEPVDYGPIYTVPGEPYMTPPPAPPQELSSQQQHTHQL